MRAVMPSVPQFILDWRKRTGIAQRDEMWEGVLHMSPEPDREHQDFEWALETWLRRHWARRGVSGVHHRINLALLGAGRDWIYNYRIPDLVLLTRERFSIDHRTHFEGGPNVAIEIRSPDDESEDKLPFYAQLGITEVSIIDRDTKQPDLYVLAGGAYRKQSAEASGWFRSGCTGIEFRVGQPGKFAIRLANEEASCEELPEEQ